MSEIYTDIQSEDVLTSHSFDRVARWLILPVIAGGMFLALYGITPPRSMGIDAPLSEFSSSRALKNVELIASRPRPIGSTAHQEVRAALLRQLNDLGLDPQVQQATVAIWGRNNSVNAATVANVVARLKGTEGKTALMLAAHYDSVPISPGASDNAVGVATLLETARALKSGPPLQNDVVFLFTDGEETGLFGARAFVDEHPWAKDVRLALNFDARGNSGPSIMFETSPGNQELISGLAKTATKVVASSLSYDVYKFLPNDSDLSVFKQANIAGLNFAYIGGITHYHSSLDTPDRVYERSLQHHGSQALALSRYFGSRSLAFQKTSDAIYFDLIGTALARYPAALAIPLAALAMLLFAAMIYLGLRRGSLKLKAILRAIGVIFVSLIAAPLIISVLWRLIVRAQGARGLTLQEINYHSMWYLLGFIALTLAVCAALRMWLGRKIEMRDWAVAGAFWWVIAALLSSLFLPGGSYLFIWPLLFNVAGLGLLLKQRDWPADGLKCFVVKAFAAIPPILLWPPIIYLIFTSIGFDAIGLVALMTTLTAVLLILPLHSLLVFNGWRVPTVTSLIGIALLMVGIFVTGTDSSRPRLSHLFYAMNATTGKAIWASGDEKPDEWTSQYLAGGRRQTLNEYFPWRTESFLNHDAPNVSIPAPELTLLSEERREDARILNLRAKSLREAPIMTIAIDPDSIVEAATINGRQVAIKKASFGSEDRQYWRLNYYAAPVEGVNLTLKVKTTGLVKILATDQSYGLPEIPGVDYKPRPQSLMPSARRPYSDQSLVNKSFTF